MGEKPKVSKEAKELLRILRKSRGLSVAELEEKVRARSKGSRPWSRLRDWQPYLYELSTLRYRRQVERDLAGKLHVVKPRSKGSAKPSSR